ncbi:hypothetical protein F8154_12280 [Alkaliphilus pronyensis]|uniref:YjcZ family sporulation protein n=1 Tax=Alkaliphilus pronyensis TaxID=1482732 RepID=A0A6I0F8G2_9FIRM|nr:hypothetical protein [Alkaliphilus pronyensis]KAB3532044.1 hypothetical protein F8154_12280 [Alkaliphilus pronyensis]
MTEVRGNVLFGGVGGTNILLFFLILVVILINCPIFKDCGDSLLFFFLILVALFTGPTWFCY